MRTKWYLRIFHISGGFGGPAIPAGRFGAYEPEYPSAAGFQASRGAGRYDDFDDEPPARFAGKKVKNVNLSKTNTN